MRPYTHTEKVGVVTVTDATRQALTCCQCGETYVSADTLGIYELRAARAALLEGKVTGEAMRYARKALGLSRDELGRLLDRTEENVAAWESTASTRVEQLAMVGLLGLRIEPMAKGVELVSILTN